ncbi:MAG: hypothetical protein ACLRMX_00930 [Lachnospira eligens]
MNKINTRAIKAVPIYNESGEKLDEIHIKETIMPIPNKRGGYSERVTITKAQE